MSFRKLKTTISTLDNLCDESGNCLPAGNYYFTIKDFKNDCFVGDVKCRGDFGEFIFSPINLVKMMAVGQSRLFRKAKMSDEDGMPDYPSPVTSPVNNSSYKLPPLRSKYTVNYRDSTYFHLRNRKNTTIHPVRIQPTQCSICMENIDILDRKTLICFHKFHRKCINIWLQEKNTCPLCRKVQNTTNRPVRLRHRDPFLEAVADLQRDYARNTIVSRRF